MTPSGIPLRLIFIDELAHSGWHRFGHSFIGGQAALNDAHRKWHQSTFARASSAPLLSKVTWIPYREALPQNNAAPKWRPFDTAHSIMRNSIVARVHKCEPLQVGASECPWRYFELVQSAPGAVPKLLTNRELGCLQLDALASLLRQRGTRGGTTFAATTSCLRETLAAGALPLVS